MPSIYPDESLTQEQVAFDRLRVERLLQIAIVASGGLLFAGLFYVSEGVVIVSLCLAAGLVSMFCTYLLARMGKIAAASALFISSICALVFTMLWTGEGLQDPVLLCLPALLVTAGLLLTTRSYYILLGAVCVGLLCFWYADHVLALRPQGYVSPDSERVRDVLSVLVVSAIIVWLVQRDWVRALGELSWQIDHYKVTQQELKYLSEHDSLTGLPNRVLAAQLVQHAIDKAAKQNRKVALLFVDLDRFKSVNDALGHSAGDDFLREVAARLRAQLPAVDVVARQGGDEFVIGLADARSRESVAELTERILQALSTPIRVQHQEVPCSCSVGVAFFPDDAVDYDTLLQHADIAMYQAKEAGRNAYRFFEPSMQEQLQRYLHVAAGLRQALSAGEFVLHYQPIVTVEDGGRLVGAEALLRWQHPEMGLVSPAHFIGVAEQTGLIMEVGLWVLNEACRQAQAWRTLGYPDMRMAVNLSAVQLQRGTIELVVMRALEQSGLPPHCLELEITESMLMGNTDSVAKSLAALRAKGVHIAIDDFGTGYSNLGYLRQFSVNKLKIDQSFVRNIVHDPSQQALVKAIIQMTKSLGLVSQAEGVEHEEEQHLLHELQCDLGQGYWYGRPMPAAQFERYMQDKQLPPYFAQEATASN